MPHVPLKVLRGDQEQEDVQDQHFERFQAPGTTTEDTEDDKDTDDDCRTSNDQVADLGETSEEGRERYLSEPTGSIDNVVQFDNDIPNHQNNNRNSEYNTIGSVNDGTSVVAAVAQVHQHDTENNDTAPLLANMH